MTAIKSKVRDSNMELLRIVAMILVMVVHANFRAMHFPTGYDLAISPSSVFLRYFTESLSIICVNVFVLLSGWYGIHFKISRLLEFIFQVMFFSIVIFALFFILAKPDMSIVVALKKVFLLGQWDYWFVKAYLVLYLFSPILNAFVEKVGRKELELFLLMFFAFEVIFGWLYEGVDWFMKGFSPISFMGLYLLARYVKLYRPKWSNLDRKADIAIYLILALVNTYFAIRLTAHPLAHSGINKYSLFSYLSPLVIVQAVFFLLFFSKLSFKSKAVNWIAASAFAIYLVHSNSFVSKPYYDNLIAGWFSAFDTLPFLAYTACWIILVFCISILADKVRIWIWEFISPTLQKLDKERS
jgi:surface polysaccharide O-acyltransferase-like enzyme